MNRIHSIDPVSYASTRNHVNGHVTRLSPYICRGVIPLKLILNSVIENGFSLARSEKLVQELAWREYFQRVWQEKGKGIETDIKNPQQETAHDSMLQAVNEASTGIEAIDRHISQLYETGYMHNHVRMYTASICCNIAKAYWKQPADWMYYHLLDGDLASNYCSWQWVAGTFSSKKYYCNQENINRYTGSNQRGSFLDKSYPELPLSGIPPALSAKINLQLTTVLPVTNLPVIEEEWPTLIYNSYNLDPNWRKNEKVNRILLLEPSHFRQYPVSEKVLRFIIDLSGNIDGIQLYCGEFESLCQLYKNKQQPDFIFKEHPLNNHYIGKTDQREWLFNEVKGYYPSFSAYWKKCKAYLSVWE